MDVLLIGGSRDGETIAIPENYFPVLKVPTSNFGPKLETEEYLMRKICTEEGTLELYVHSSLTIYEAVTRLLDNYKP
jgi:hypothetical protein